MIRINICNVPGHHVPNWSVPRRASVSYGEIFMYGGMRYKLLSIRRKRNWIGTLLAASVITASAQAADTAETPDNTAKANANSGTKSSAKTAASSTADDTTSSPP
jgi:iron complex outermembrane recepter protein